MLVIVKMSLFFDMDEIGFNLLSTVCRPWGKLILLDSGGEALSRINLLVRVASVLMPLKSARPVDALVQQQIYLFSMSERLFYNYSQRPVAN